MLFLICVNAGYSVVLCQGQLVPFVDATFSQVFLDNLGIGLTIGFIVGVSVLIVVLKIIFIDPPIM